MFKDRDEELERLQAELLEEEEQETAEEEYLEDDVEQLLEEEEDVDSPEIYRNFASGYKAYNTDKADADLWDMSQRIMEPPEKKRGGCLAALLIFLLTALLLAILWLLAKKEGLL